MLFCGFNKMEFSSNHYIIGGIFQLAITFFIISFILKDNLKTKEFFTHFIWNNPLISHRM